MPNVSNETLITLARKALEAAGASSAAALSAARFLVAAEAEGLASHGLSRLSFYCAHLRNGRTVGDAQPRIVRERGGACLVDAGYGMAFPACELAVRELVARVRMHGVAFAGVTNSNHFGVAALHLLPLAEAGMVGLAFSNSPAAMPAWGGKTPLFGTNPIAAVFPRRDADPLVIDLSLSEAARGKIMLAAKEGKSIPKGWALDKEGRPTTDARAALAGSMLPAGGLKGAMLALIVELLACALTGAAFGFEADSFFSEQGNRPRIGQAFLAIDPDAVAGRETYLARVETLIGMMLSDPGVRLPGMRRQQRARRTGEGGISITDALYDQMRQLADA